MSKNTVTVTASWYSSDPTLDQAQDAVRQEMKELKFLTVHQLRVLEELLPLNGGAPFRGRTEWGPHTHLRFEAGCLSEAVESARVLEEVLRILFPDGEGVYQKHFLGLNFHFAGRRLPELILMLETAITEAQQDIKITRRLLPSKKLYRLRQILDEIHQ